MCFHKEILILKIDVAAYLDINNIYLFCLKHTNHLNQCLMANLKKYNFDSHHINFTSEFNFGKYLDLSRYHYSYKT